MALDFSTEKTKERSSSFCSPNSKAHCVKQPLEQTKESQRQTVQDVPALETLSPEELTSGYVSIRCMETNC